MKKRKEILRKSTDKIKLILLSMILLIFGHVEAVVEILILIVLENMKQIVKRFFRKNEKYLMLNNTGWSMDNKKN
jgi:hypothetical protein